MHSDKIIEKKVWDLVCGIEFWIGMLKFLIDSNLEKIREFGLISWKI